VVGRRPHPPARARCAAQSAASEPLRCTSWPGSWLHAKLGMQRILDIKRTIARCPLPAFLPVLLCLIVSVAPAKAATTSEEAVHARVEECYNALQEGDWRKVEKYLTRESKPIFRSQTKKPLPGYQIQSVKIDPDGKTATVVVAVPVVSVSMPAPILVPRPTTWRLIGHDWYMELPRPEPGGQQMVLGMKPPVMRPRPPLIVPQDLKFVLTGVSVGNVQSAEVKVARYQFTNATTHDVTLSDFQLGCPCLRLVTKQMEYKPGESGTVEIEFDAAKLGAVGDEAFEQDVYFKTNPGGAYVKLTISAMVLVGSPQPAPKP